MLSIHSEIIPKSSGLQFDKVKYTKVSHHRGMSPGKTTHNKMPAKNSLWENKSPRQKQTHLNFRNLHAEIGIPKEVRKG